MRRINNTHIRAAPEFKSLLERWKQDAQKSGYDYSMTDIQKILANKMNGMSFRPDIKVFKEYDLYDSLFPVRKQRRR